MKIAIVDDTKNDIQLLKTYIKEYFIHNYSGIPLTIHEYPNGETFLISFSQSSYDIIFLDYYMKKLTGLETAQIIRKTDFTVHIIFITVSRDFAVDSYRVKACGYLVKPFTYEAFYETMSLNLENILKKLQFVEFVNGKDFIRVFLKDIIFCDISGHYSQIHTSDTVIRIRMAFSKLVDVLKPYPEFLLCYRGCLVNMKKIIKIENQAFLMSDGERIPFRKKEQNNIMKTYSSFLFEKVRNHEL